MTDETIPFSGIIKKQKHVSSGALATTDSGHWLRTLQKTKTQKRL